MDMIEQRWLFLGKRRVSDGRVLDCWLPETANDDSKALLYKVRP